MQPDQTASWPIERPYDFFETTRLLRTGHRDPTVQRETDGLWRTAHTSEGPVTVRITIETELIARAWGPGATAAMELVPRWVGLHEPPWSFPPHPRLDAMFRAHAGLRGTDTTDVFEALLNLVLQQLVTWSEAAFMWRRLCEVCGDVAPGPREFRLSPTPTGIRRAGLSRLQSAGISAKQARTLLEIALVAHALPRATELATPDAKSLLQKIRGVGPWTADMVLGLRLARPDPIPLGDFHLANTVAWALASEPRATDTRMLELLRPFEGCAFRVLRVLFAARVSAPARGPKRGWSRSR